jgi:holin-like protein
MPGYQQPVRHTSIHALHGFAWLLALQAVGELLVRGLGLTVPGPVVGMALLLVALRWPGVRNSVAGCADFLLGHLSLLFVPVGVGVMTHLGVMSDYGLRIAVVLVLSTWTGLAATALMLRWLQKRPDSESPADKSTKASIKPSSTSSTSST